MKAVCVCVCKHPSCYTACLMHTRVCPRLLFPGHLLLNPVLSEARGVSLWNPSILGPITIWGNISSRPFGFPGCFCSQAPSALQLLGRPALPLVLQEACKGVKSKQLILLEKNCFVLCLAKFLSITLFYKFPRSQFPQTTKLQFAG